MGSGAAVGRVTSAVEAGSARGGASGRGETQGLDEGEKGRGLLAAAGVIEEETGKGLAPVVEHADEFAGFEVGHGVFIGQEGEADAVESGTSDEADVIHDERPADGNREGLLPFFKFPTIEAGGAVAEVDAAMLEKIAGNFGSRMRFEIGGRADDGGAVIGRDTDGDHVLLNVFAEVDSGVETAGDDVHAVVVGGDLEDDIGEFAGELAELGGEDAVDGEFGQEKADAAGGMVAAAGDLLEGEADFADGGAHTGEELFAGESGGNAAGGPGEQADVELLFEAADGVADGRGSDAEAAGGAGEAALVGDGEENGEIAEIVVVHS